MLVGAQAKLTHTLRHVSAPSFAGSSSNCSAPAALSSSYQGACAVMADKTARCWGETHAGTDFNTTPVKIAGLDYIRAIAPSGSHTCALLVNGTVACWGSNDVGGLGTTAVRSSLVPLQVNGLSGVESIVAGTSRTCVVLIDRTVKCWGEGPLCGGEYAPRPCFDGAIPAEVTGLTGARSLSVGSVTSWYACAVLTDGGVGCWAGNGPPFRVNLSMEATAIASGLGHTCALLVDHTVACWGRNDHGQAGCSEATCGHSLANPVRVAGLLGVASITAGDVHTCAVLQDNTAKCWGSNSAGALGDGTFDWESEVSYSYHSTPVTVKVSGIGAMAGGGFHTCALLLNSSVACWGGSWRGQTGSGRVDTCIPSPVLVKDLC